MKVLLNLIGMTLAHYRTDDLSDQLKFISIRAVMETNSEDYTGVIEIVVNEYCGAAYINLHSAYTGNMGFVFCSQEMFNRRPRLMMEEDEELDVSMIPYSYEKFDEPPEDEEPEYEDDDYYAEEEDR